MTTQEELAAVYTKAIRVVSGLVIAGCVAGYFAIEHNKPEPDPKPIPSTHPAEYTNTAGPGPFTIKVPPMQEFETTVIVLDPTADRVITCPPFPDDAPMAIVGPPEDGVIETLVLSIDLHWWKTASPEEKLPAYEALGIEQ